MVVLKDSSSSSELGNTKKVSEANSIEITFPGDEYILL